MTVLQVCAFAAPNAGNFIASLTQLEDALSSKGIQTIYAFSDGAQKTPWCQEIQKRAKVYFLPTAKARILPKTYSIFRRIYKENEIDIIHSHFELYDIPATVTAPKHIKVFWHLHDAIKAHYSFANLARKLLIRFQYSSIWKNVKILSVSREHASFVKSLGFAENHICYFPNGIYTSRIKLVSSPKREPIFLMFGWEIYRKGVDLVVEAAKKLEDDICRIRIVGQDDCRKFINSQGNVNSIVYLPPVEDVNSLYQSSSAFIHISRSEGLSYALLEVIYAGLPVICSNIPENQFAKIFRNVIFVDNDNVDKICSSIYRMVQQPITPTQEEILYNRRIIEQEYSIDVWAEKLISIYLESK